MPVESNSGISARSTSTSTWSFSARCRKVAFNSSSAGCPSFSAPLTLTTTTSPTGLVVTLGIRLRSADARIIATPTIICGALRLLLQLRLPVHDHHHRQGRLLIHAVDEEALAVRRDRVRVSRARDGRAAEQRGGHAGLETVAARAHGHAHDAAVARHVEEFLAVMAPVRRRSTVG